jgi:hypothetical protein
VPYQRAKEYPCTAEQNHAAAAAKGRDYMLPNIPKPSIYKVEEEEWMETLHQILAEAGPKTLWVTLQSTVLLIRSRPFELRLDEQTLRLLEPRQSPEQLEGQRTVCVIALPAHQSGHYRKIATPDGHICLWANFRLYREGDPEREKFAVVAIATSAEALNLAGSEAPLPSVIQ